MGNGAIAVLTTGVHKTAALLPMLVGCGCEARRVPVLVELGELEHHSPDKVLRGKLVDYVHHVEPQLPYWATVLGVGNWSWVMVLDLLGVQQTEEAGRLDQAELILKKASLGDAIGVATSHFRKLAQSRTDGAYHHTIYLPGAGLAPVKAGRVVWEKMRTRWDAVEIDMSSGMVDLLGDEARVRAMVEAGVLPQAMFNPNSILGIKLELGMDAFAWLAAERADDGLSMRIKHGKRVWEIDSQTDRGTLANLMEFMRPAMANATPCLARQIISTVAAWA